MNNTNSKLQEFLTSPKGLTIMVVCVAVLLAVYLLLSTSSKVGTKTAVKTTITPSVGITNNQSSSTNIKIDPKLITSDIYLLKNPDGKTIYVNLNTGKDSISGVQLAISYNPNLISTISITPGDFFDNPTILQNAVDTNNGIIYYSLSIPPSSGQIYGEGTVAIIHYNGIPAGVGTTISILPQTKVTTKGVNGSVLKQAKSISIP